ncbi:unnamed protein product [Aphanomyces euteiches]
MFTQLVHISICNVLLLTPGYLMHTRFRSDKTSDECIHYNFTRVVLRSILFFTTIILYLPATGHARFQLYKLRDKPKAPGPVLERSFFLKLCESVALCDIILMFGTALLILLGAIYPAWAYDCQTDIQFFPRATT